MSQQEFNDRMARWIESNRTRRKMSRAALALAIGTSWGSIDGWEKGKYVPSSYFYAKLRTFFRDNPVPLKAKKQAGVQA